MRSSARVAAYVDLRSTTRKPTGVDKHIARMVHGLASTPGFGVSVLAPRSQLAGAAGMIPESRSLAGLPVDAIPFSNRQAGMLRDPTKSTCAAVTTYFEPAHPGYRRAGVRFECARQSPDSGSMFPAYVIDKLPKKLGFGNQIAQQQRLFQPLQLLHDSMGLTKDG